MFETIQAATHHRQAGYLGSPFPRVPHLPAGVREEFTSPTTTQYSPRRHLLRGDVKLRRGHLSLLIKASKTDSYRKTCTLPVAATGNNTCPVAAMRQGTTPHAPCLPSPLASSSHGLASRQFSASSSRPRACQQHKPNSMAPRLVQPQMQQLRASLPGSSRPRAGGKVQPKSGTYTHLRRHSCRWLRLWRHSPGLEHQGGEAIILLTNLGELGGRHRLRSMPEGTALRRGMARKPAGRLGIGATGHPTASRGLAGVSGLDQGLRCPPRPLNSPNN